ncbi:MAG TPA: SCO family protein [Gemmataceae bacterium]|nr:SCO family protein [Gemmataceae bacterium]
MSVRIGWLAGGLMLLALAAARAEDRLPASLPKVGLDQRLNEQVPLDLGFRDEAGRTVRLGAYFDGKPVILVLAYYRCPMLCNQVLNGLVEGLRQVSLDAGREFRVVVVSFDAREQPELAAAKKASYVEVYGRPGTEGGWHFLTGDQPAIDALTAAVGFRYAYDATLDQFAHTSGIMVLTPRGKIARYFYGIRYPPRDLRLGLVEAAEEKIGTPADRLLLLCYRYDPSTGRYTPLVMNLVRLGGVLTLAVLGTFLGLAWRRERRRTRQSLSEPRPSGSGLSEPRALASGPG